MYPSSIPSSCLLVVKVELLTTRSISNHLWCFSLIILYWPVSWEVNRGWYSLGLHRWVKRIGQFAETIMLAEPSSHRPVSSRADKVLVRLWPDWPSCKLWGKEFISRQLLELTPTDFSPSPYRQDLDPIEVVHNRGHAKHDSSCRALEWDPSLPFKSGLRRNSLSFRELKSSSGFAFTARRP